MGGGNLLPRPDSSRCGAYADALDDVVENCAPTHSGGRRLERRSHGIDCRHRRIFRCALVAMVIADLCATSTDITADRDRIIDKADVLMPRDERP